ncbi:putative arylsulfatase, partial [Fistulina hepatica ATCC 64428]
KPPNILFIFNDDQDLLLGSMNYLPSVVSRIQQQGMTFNNHYATVALCCPSRIAILRGQHAHNTNNTYVSAPGGGYDKLLLSGEDQDYLPNWLAQAGYHSEYIGKLLNGYGTYNFAKRPKGWDHFDGLLDPYTYIYNTPVFSENGAWPKYYPQHQTDVLHAKAINRLEKLLANPDQPWFLELAPVSPHQQFNSTGMWPPVPPSRYEQLFPGLQAPRSPNWNPVVQKKPSWVGELPYMDSASIAFADDTYRRRSQALHGLNEMFDDILDVLEASGQMDNTYIIFSADHGYHVGNHRVPAGKTLPYREDTLVPFYIRGPGIEPGSSTDLPSNHIDIAPTVLTITGLDESSWPIFLDGRPLSSYWEAKDPNKVANVTLETINIEFWGDAIIEVTGLDLNTSDSRNTYKTLRIVGGDYGYLYSHWCTNETELYDTVTDPYELSPLNVTDPANVRLASRLNGLLLVTKSCSQATCRNPWLALHPSGTVTSLPDAMNDSYDDFYNSLPQVSFQTCLDYQLISNELPLYPV